MKTRFNTYDLICIVSELQQLIGMRVNQVYDIDSKTYLIRLQLGEKKTLLLLESGIRIHTTSFEWPKNMAPSGFSMKMRKHIRNKRLEKLKQLGLDRIVDLQFGSGEAAYHVIIELYDKGNIILTDYSYTILNLLRPHTEGEAIKFVVREKYPSNRGKKRPDPPTDEFLRKIFDKEKSQESLKKILNPHLIYGPSIIDHILLSVGISPSLKLKDFNLNISINKLQEAFMLAETILNEAFIGKNKGYIIKKKETGMKQNEDFFSNQEFHPVIFEQHKNCPFSEFDSFDKAVDEFFSNMENQKIDVKGIQQELIALKKLENVKKDHEKRIMNLEISQAEDIKKAELISRNQKLVDDVILTVRQAVASQMSWTDIENLIKEATHGGDSVASIIKQLKLNINHITLFLSDPYDDHDENGEALFKSSLVDVDLDLSAYANAEKYYDKKRLAATKKQKTIESQDKAFKSAEKKTKQTLKEVKTNINITKARKVYWFEKFYWFISSENYLVIGGRDQQQNEIIVKKYLKLNDIYVHAGIVGASSVVIKNPNTEPVSPKTLNEAGTMAMCYSNAWDAKVVTSAWWVHANQVSKTAPTGEYLTTGSFMIRGKKHFLPQCHLILGFTFLFKLEDDSLERHIGERKIKEIEDCFEKINNETNEQDDIELQVLDESSDEYKQNLSTIEEDKECKIKSNTVLECETNNKENLTNSKEEQECYPDTEVLVEHIYDKIKCNVNMKIINQKNNCNLNENVNFKQEKEEYVIYLGDNIPVVMKSSLKVKSINKINNEKSNENEDNLKTEAKTKQSKQKRGQKSKLKKIKEKYKDQDEEERKLRMEILQGTSVNKEKKKNKKDKKKTSMAVEKKESEIKKSHVPVKLLPIDDDLKDNVTVDEDNDDKEEICERTVSADVDMLNSLTGQPLPEDELLFAIPMVAPYNAIMSYKYKVKLTPGTSKRGKSAKTALNLFIKDKSASTREKDLIKFVKDQDLARNFPGKVKISAPQLIKHK